MTVRRALGVALAGVGLAATAATAQGDGRRLVTGFVRDSTGTPIPLALVVGNVNTKVASNDSGRFAIRAASGVTLTLDVRRIGFRPAFHSLPPGGDTTILVIMTPLAQRLTAVEVIATQSRSLELSGFYRRMAERERGILHGEFITPEEIEQRNPPRITHMMDMVEGVRIKRVDGNPLHWEVLGPGSCVMTVYLDGMRLNRLDLRRNTMKDFLDEIVTPTSVAGIEIYRSATRAPPQYQSLAAACGVVLLWTR